MKLVTPPVWYCAFWLLWLALYCLFWTWRR